MHLWMHLWMHPYPMQRNAMLCGKYYKRAAQSLIHPTSDQNQLLLHTWQKLLQGWHTNTNINKHYFQRPQILQIHSLEMCRRVLGGT